MSSCVSVALQASWNMKVTFEAGLMNDSFPLSLLLEIPSLGGKTD